MSGDKKKHKDKSITIRINSEVADVTDRLAEEYGVTRSDIIRLAVDNSLSAYLDRVRYMDPEQGKVINKNIITLGNVMAETLYNLRRIGANFDQLLHRINAGQAVNLYKNKDLITHKDLDDIMVRMETVVKKVGDNLHVFTD